MDAESMRNRRTGPDFSRVSAWKVVLSNQTMLSRRRFASRDTLGAEHVLYLALSKVPVRDTQAC
jgi:hypothetical protein